MRPICSILALLVLAAGNLLAQSDSAQIELVGFAGSSRTDTQFLHEYLGIERRDPYTNKVRDEGAQQLRNLGIFSNVTARIESTEQGNRITYYLDEALPILPLLNFGGISENFWFRVGAFDRNTFGRAGLFHVSYRYYDRHSFETYLTAPYQWGPQWGIHAYAGRLATREPVIIAETDLEYDVDRWVAIARGRYNVNRKLHVELGGGVLIEEYDKVDTYTGTPGPAQASFQKTLGQAMVVYDDVDYFGHRVTGFYEEAVAEIVTTAGEAGVFWKFINTLKGYTGVWKDGIIGARLRTGIAKNDASPFLPFVLDSYINVRGVGNRTARGSSEVTVNLEYRHTVLEGSFGAVEAVSFVDVSGWRQAGQSFSETFAKDNTVSFAGVGARFYVQPWLNMVFRIDYGHSLRDDNRQGFVVGTGHYF